MVVRATSDLHLSPATERWVFAALGELRKDAVEHEGVTVLCGDIFDQGELVHMRLWNRLRDMLRGWPGSVVVIVGNHDQYDGERNALEGLASDVNEIMPIRVVSTPHSCSIGAVVAYSPDFTKASKSAIGYLVPAHPRVLWCHQGFQGAYVNAMRKDRDGAHVGAVPSEYMIISGHYHMPQTLGRLVYCGSPYETSFAEEGQRKGWLRWADIYEDTMPERIAFGDLGAPRHHTVHWDPEKGEPLVPAGLLAFDRVRVVTAASRKVALAAADQLKRAGLDGAALLAAPDIGIGRGVVEAGMDSREAARRYAATFGADPHRPDPAVMDEWAEERKLWGS